LSPSERDILRHSQNFLRDPALVRHLLDASTLNPEDTVYEIGPGRGVITDALARRCGRVIAVEKDPALARALRQRFADAAHVAVVDGDFLEHPLPDAPYKVFANVPFNVTAAVVTKLLAAPRPPEDSYLIVQREAAERFLGAPAETLYAALLKPWFEPSVLYRFARADFVPAPRVDVVLLRLRKRGPPLVPEEERRSYRDFVTHCFTARHRTIRGTLSPLLGGPRAHQLLARLRRATARLTVSRVDRPGTETVTAPLLDPDGRAAIAR
jgi:23S rRNA (adenine-N6)-dimethyltransferase